MRHGHSQVEPSTLEAWAKSYLAELPVDLRDAILKDAFVVTIPTGQTIYEAYGPPRLALLHWGQARVKVVSRDGRAATIRYAGAGQVIGLPAVIAGSSPVGADALVDCEVSMLNVATLCNLASTDARVAWLLAQQVTDIVFEAVEFLADNLFGSVQQRVGRHLLDLASNSPGGLIVQVDQQEIANAIGSVREVVARTLRRFREAGYIDKVPGGLRLIDPSKLHAIAAGRPIPAGDNGSGGLVREDHDNER